MNVNGTRVPELTHPMKFALLGADRDSLALAEAAEAAGHSIAWRGAETSSDDSTWEDLVDPAVADAILVAAAAGDGEDARARQLQELAKLGRPLLAAHPVVSSVISYFEIDMARAESGAVLQHYNPLVEAECVDRLAGWVRTGHPQLGAVEQLVATRRLANRSRERVVRHFARDVELLARLAGRLDRIGAHAATDDPSAAYASLSVQLSGPQRVPVRWSVEPIVAGSDLQVTLVCQHGRVTLVIDESGRAVELAEQRRAAEKREQLAGASPAMRALLRFVDAVRAGDGGASTWPGALDAMELADSIEISLRRGRMIDVHHRELTEQLAFRGVMSALGCGVLVVLVPAALAIGWIAGILKAPLSDYWPHALLAVLTAFLGLQILPRLIAGPPKDRNHGRDSSRAARDSAD
jgi:hypothetical protein